MCLQNAGAGDFISWPEYLLLFLALSRMLGVYVSALWFGSIGYSPVYWYVFKLKAGLFVVFLVLTVLILRGAFWLLERAFAAQDLAAPHNHGQQPAV